MSAQASRERQNAERIFARVFTVLGGVFWIITAFFMPRVGQLSALGAFNTAIYPLIFTIGVLALGWFYERLTALILALGAVGTIAWGFIQGWEPIVWGVMLLLFVTPTVIAAVLYYLAGSAGGGEASDADAEAAA